MEGGQVSEIRKEESNQTYHDRNFYKINKAKKRSEIFASLRPGRMGVASEGMQTNSTNVDSKPFLTKTDSLQLKDEFETLNEPDSPLAIQNPKNSMKSVSKMIIVPR